jgi:hypothetical protein
MYTSSLRRTHAVVQSTVTQWTRTAATAPVVDPSAPDPAPAPDRLPLLRLAGAAVAVLAITLGAVTGVEGLLGKPLANLLGGSDATGTSLGSVGSAGGSGTKHRAETTRSPNGSATSGTPSTPTATPSSAPTAQPTAQPTSDPTATPTTPTPTVDPTSTPTGP